MQLLFRHTFPLEAWLAVKPGIDSPDARIVIKRVVKLVDRCPLVFSFQSMRSPECSLDEGLNDIDVGDNFFVGVEPKVKRVTVDRSEEGSTAAVEFEVFAGSVVYHAETATLYTCASLPDNTQ